MGCNTISLMSDRHRNRCSQRENDTKRQREKTAVYKSGEMPGAHPSHWPSQGNDTLISDFRPPHLWESTSVVSATEFVILCYSGHRKLTQQTTDWGKIHNICKLHVQQNTCIQKTFLKTFPNSTARKINSPIEKQTTDLNRYVTKENIRMENNYMKRFLDHLPFAKGKLNEIPLHTY